MKKTVAAFLVAVVLLGMLSPARALDESSLTVKWRGTASASFIGEAPENYRGSGIDSQMLRIGKAEGGGDFFAFVRSPLGSDFFAEEISEARLFLKTARGKAPEKLRMGNICGYWSWVDAANFSEAKSLVDEESLSVVAARPENDGWVSLDLTEMVKAWLRGEARNDGIALFGADGEAQAMFVSAETWSKTEEPYIEVTGKIGARGAKYGKFGYSQQPTEGLIHSGGGNCLAYALRDNIPVSGENLGIAHAELNRIYSESGDGGVVEYIAGLLEDYVEKYRAELCISNFRRIEGFDGEIDPESEYRIALRVGCDPEHPMKWSARNFDFHFWAQISDGRWAHKPALAPSRIVPGSPGVSPEKYAWNIGEQWTDEKTYGFYGSKAVYYAVTKHTDEFTEHRKSPFADADIYAWLGGVGYAYSNGFMSAVSAQPMLFGSDLPLTRGMAVAALHRYHMKASSGENMPAARGRVFFDVPEGSEYYPATSWAAENGIAVGYDTGAFGVHDEITREQLAAMFLNYELFSGNIPPDDSLEFEFFDADKISGWAMEAAKQLVAQRLLRAPMGLFDPRGKIARIEFAEMLWNFNYLAQR